MPSVIQQHSIPEVIRALSGMESPDYIDLCPVGATKLFLLGFFAPSLRNLQKFFKHGVKSPVHFVSASSAFPA